MAMTKSRRKIAAAFREVNRNEPGVVQSTRRKFGARRAAKQKVAIALSKARARGARVKAPKMDNNPMSPGVRLVTGDLSRGYRSLGKARR